MTVPGRSAHARTPPLGRARRRAGRAAGVGTSAGAGGPGTVRAVIGYLKGTARGSRIVVTEAGVGYVVSSAVPLRDGVEVELVVTTVVREDAITLYGFATEVDQALFVALCKIPGVGPAMGLSLVRDLGAVEVVGAVGAGEARRLTRAGGVGPKVAEKILAMLVVPAEVAEAANSAQAPRPAVVELAGVLEGLGYDRATATAAAQVGVDAAPGGPEAVQLSGALGHLRGAA